MNLKYKLTNKLTATIKFISDTQAIFSDEVSPTHINALSIMTAADKTTLWSQVRAQAILLASTTKFPCVICVIDPTDKITIITPKAEQSTFIQE